MFSNAKIYLNLLYFFLIDLKNFFNLQQINFVNLIILLNLYFKYNLLVFYPINI